LEIYLSGLYNPKDFFYKFAGRASSKEVGKSNSKKKGFGPN